MQLPEDDTASVGRMVPWLYTKKIDLTVPVCDATSAECYMQLAQLNALAEKYDIRSLKNDIVDEIFDLRKPPKNIKPPQMPVIMHVYNTTTGGSSFRKLLVAWYVYGIDCEWYAKDSTRDELVEASPDFAIDLVVAMGVKQKYPERTNPFNQGNSAFHETSPKKVDQDHA